MMLFLFSLVASLLGVAAARARAVAREARRAQALALAESAVVAAQAQLDAGRPAAPVTGSLPTGSYAAEVHTAGGGEVRLAAVGRARPLLGEAVEVRIEVTLARRGAEWSVIAWQEVPS